ncbi:MAG: L-rhamnose/proton symporter RhaT [Candidatus Latescibacterota bacterium]
MDLIMGFFFVILAGASQGSFYLPATYTKKWEWEHSWLVFSITGMLIINWIIALILIPDIFKVFQVVTMREILVILLFGAGWGAGAICNGLAIDRLGMALAYPITLGLVACLGALIPLIIFFPATLFATKGLVLISGTVLVVVGIVMISIAGSRKQPTGSTAIKGSFAVGLVIAICAGVFSCFFNIGYAFSVNLAEQAKALGTSATFASSAVWAPFLTVGCLVNAGYSLYLMITRKTGKGFVGPHFGFNLLLASLMGLLWIGGVYFYSIGASKLGGWGVVVGWVLFMSSIILVGNLWGIFKGEWKGAPAAARSLLNRGITVLLLAIIIVAYSNSL